MHANNISMHVFTSKRLPKALSCSARTCQNASEGTQMKHSTNIWKGGGRLFLLLLTILLPATYATAQEFTGRVTDSTGAVVSKASVTALNLDTNVSINTVTNNTGAYTIPYLKPGNYSVTVLAKGFETSVHTGIVLQVGQTSTVDFSLKVGAASETVTVNADTLLDVGKADIGEVVENARVTELPLNGRDPNMLSILNAGAIWTGSIQYQRPFDDTQENLSINGGGSGQNALLLDGMSNEAAATNNTGNSKIAYVAPVDAVQEFKIVTNPYDASQGRAAGGVVDMTLKTGTNTLHGDVYEFARRTFLDSNFWQNDWIIAKAKGSSSYESTKQQYATEQHKLDQYGAELDGPIRIPWLYNGRNKTFFLLQYENWNETVPNALVTSVPDPNWVSGDFSNLTWWNGSNNAYEPIWVYDPASLSCDTKGNCTRKTFAAEAGHPGDPAYNKIPQGRINSVAQTIMSYYPKPNLTPAQGTNPFGNNFSTPNPTTDRYRNVLGKIDENFTQRDRFSLRYGYWERVEVRNTNGMPGPIAEGQLPHGERSHTFAMDEVHTFSPNLLFDFRAVAVARADYSFGGPAGFDPTTLGWDSSLVNQLGPAGMSEFPEIQFSEFAYIGNNGSSQTVSNSLSILPSVTWIKGAHTIHAGLDARFMQSGNDVIGGGPYWWEDRQWTQSNYVASQWTNDSGNSFSSFLLGDMSSGNVSINTKTYWSQHYWAPFVQDDWKVTRKLTLNLGVRWDFNPAMTERHDYGDYAFDTESTNPIDSEVDHSLLPNGGPIKGGVTFLGVNGNPRLPYATIYTNIQPRFGFAYAVHPDTVIRGGFGEMFRNPQAGPNALGYSYSTSFNSSLDGGKTPYASIDNPYPQGITQPPGSSLGLRTYLGQGPWYLNPKYQVPSFWSYSAGIEQSFGRSSTLNLSYVGSQSFNTDTTDNINHWLASGMEPCNQDLGGDPAICNNNYPTNPFKGIDGFQGSSYYSADTIQQLNLQVPYPEFGTVRIYQANGGHSWYHSLQVTGMRKWSNSLTLHGTWTWSKSMDEGGWKDENYRNRYRHIDGNDRTHRITLSGVYVLPFGRGRTILPKSNRLVDAFIGGWELGSLYIYETGWPWSVPSNPNENYIHSARLNRYTEQSTGYIRGVEPCVEQWQQDSDTNQWNLKQLTNYQYDGTCKQMDFHVVPQYGALYDTVYSQIRVPSNHQFDANFSKNFDIYERMKLQVRWEAFNVLNHPLWQEGYEGSAQDTNFGTIEKGPWGQSNLPRQMQLALKLIW